MKHTDQNDAPSSKPEGDHSQLIRSFVSVPGDSSESGKADGNPCVLFCFDAPANEPPPPSKEQTQCQSWPTSQATDMAIEVRCFSAGGAPIECCGHGLLAAAHQWQRRLQCSDLKLQMNNSLVPSWREDDTTWLRFNALPTQRCPVPPWVVVLFGDAMPAQAAAVAGDERGYLVLQWPDGFDLRQLSSPATTLPEHSQRALICTAAQPDGGQGAIQLRYFAPQYGVAEDTATGSAMRVLADYWSVRYATLTAYQCSEGGGSLLARCSRTHVEVGGRCINPGEAPVGG